MQNKGFTFIELLLIISIMIILSLVILAFINPIARLQQARDTKRKEDLLFIKSLLEEYYNEHNGMYPPAGTCAPGNCYVASANSLNGPSGPSWIPALVPTYVGKLPVDPINNNRDAWITGNYSYQYGNVSADGQHYDLFTQLEYTGDPDRCGLKDYLYFIGLLPPGLHWCTAFGGAYSNQIYALDK